MPGEPGETLIGVLGIGVGALLLYGAYKNVSVFGKQGLIQTTLTTGQFPDPSSLPGIFQSGSVVTNPGQLDAALASIAVKDPALSASIKAYLATRDNTLLPYQDKKMQDLLDKLVAEHLDAQALVISNYVADQWVIATKNTTSAGPVSPPVVVNI